MRLFLDANLLFSASKSDGAIRRLLDLALGAGHELVVDELVIAEAKRNLDLKAPAIGREALAELLGRVTRLGGASGVGDLGRFVDLPEKDLPVLAAAIRSGCDLLVTGDRRPFGPLFERPVRGVTVVAPLGLAERLVDSTGR